MYDLMIYSLKVGVCLAVFYLFFKLLLSRETFHRFNRIVVLGAMFLSFVLPLCVITVYREIPVLPEIPDGEAVATVFAEPLSEPFPWEMLAGAAFLLGAAATLLWTLCSLIGVLRLIRGGRRERLEDGAVLVDYKTDRIGEREEAVLLDRYRLQLIYYRRALEQITGKTVRQAFLYSLALQKEIPVF